MAYESHHPEDERQCRQQGFTLIELSLVLVIIGLIGGGIMLGQEIIAGAMLRSSLSQLETFNSATNSFKLKYNALPGDMRNPASFGLGIQGGIGTGGNGDGIVYSYRYFNFCGTLSNPYGCTELYNFWYHLAQAGLIGDSISGVANSGAAPANLDGYMPRLKMASNPTYIIPVTAEDANTREIFGNSFAISSFYSPDALVPSINNFGWAMTAMEAYQVDSRIDDGKPGLGRVRSMYLAVGPVWSGSGGQGCDGGLAGIPLLATYDIRGIRNLSTVQSPAKPESIDCSLIIKAQW